MQGRLIPMKAVACVGIVARLAPHAADEIHDFMLPFTGHLFTGTGPAVELERPVVMPVGTREGQDSQGRLPGDR
jgi:hypothetical protein